MYGGELDMILYAIESPRVGNQVYRLCTCVVPLPLSSIHSFCLHSFPFSMLLELHLSGGERAVAVVPALEPARCRRASATARCANATVLAHSTGTQTTELGVLAVYMLPHWFRLFFRLYFRSQEVWLQNANGSVYSVCDWTGEDPSCADSTLGYSVYDHLNIFEMNNACK